MKHPPTATAQMMIANSTQAELRDLGVPLETGTASVFDTEPGYRIAPRAYALPEIHLEPDEAAADLKRYL